MGNLIKDTALYIPSIDKYLDYFDENELPIFCEKAQYKNSLNAYILRIKLHKLGYQGIYETKGVGRHNGVYIE